MRTTWLSVPWTSTSSQSAFKNEIKTIALDFKSLPRNGQAPFYLCELIQKQQSRHSRRRARHNLLVQQGSARKAFAWRLGVCRSSPSCMKWSVARAERNYKRVFIISKHSSKLFRCCLEKPIYTKPIFMTNLKRTSPLSLPKACAM